MQNLDVISINIWQILISLCNLLLLFLILKKFLYNPVKRMLKERSDSINKQYASADEARLSAEADRRSWEEKLQSADDEADGLIKKASEQAGRRSDEILTEAREKADSIIKDAEAQAAFERKKAESDIKKEIADISVMLTEKLIDREITPEDHRSVIDSVISEIGEDEK